MDIKSLLASFQTPQQSNGGLAQQILASRFQPEEPNYSDIGNAAAAGVAGNTYVSPQTFTNQRSQDSMRQVSQMAQMQKALQPDLPQGYRMGANGQAELVPGVDPSFAKKADPYAMPMPVVLPNGKLGYASKTDVINNPTGFQPPAADPNKPMNEYQGKSSLFASRMAEAEPVLSRLKDANTLTEKGLSKIPLIGNYTVSNDFQQLDQAKRNFINATLRQESGAAINQSEFDNAEKQYFPQPGDMPDVIEQKRQNRLTAIQQMGKAAGPSFEMPDLEGASAKPVNLDISDSDIAEYKKLRGIK